MTATAIPIVNIEVQARVFELDAAIARARLEFQRDRHVLLNAFYHVRVSGLLKSTEPAVRAAMPRMTDDQLLELSSLLRKPITIAYPAIADGDRLRSLMRAPERYFFDAFVRVIGQVETLANDLRVEAERRRQHYPRLDGRLQRDALLANTFLPKVRRDQADTDPDPDYGL